MLLKSASTPLLGSLITSISESPNHFLCDASNKHTPSPGFSKTLHYGTQKFSTLSCNSSPISPAIGFSKNGLIRRAHSESNLESLVDGSNGVDEFSLLKNMPKKFQRKSNSSFLETIPSFSFHNNLRYGSDYEDSDEEYEEVTKDSSQNNGLLCRVSQYSMGNSSVMMGHDIGYENNMRYEDSGEMFLARGLGVAEFCFADVGGNCGGGGDSGGYRPVAFDKEGGDNNHGIGVEEHFKKMLEGSPSNPLFLRNYAQFLYQVKGDLEGAEEYYSRAILADPTDGDVLSQYAKLVWELHHDEERATIYFERAVQTASEDSHVHAAYASFLWEAEDEVGDETSRDSHQMQSLFSTGAMASIAY